MARINPPRLILRCWGGAGWGADQPPPSATDLSPSSVLLGPKRFLQGEGLLWVFFTILHPHPRSRESELCFGKYTQSTPGPEYSSLKTI